MSPALNSCLHLIGANRVLTFNNRQIHRGDTVCNKGMVMVYMRTLTFIESVTSLYRQRLEGTIKPKQEQETP